MAQGADPCRVEELLEHTEWVRRLAFSLVRCEATADDLVQQTFLTALEHPPVEKGATKGWLARVLRNLAIDRSRRRIRRQVREIKAIAKADENDSDIVPAEVFARLEMQELLAGAVKDLTDPYRTIVVLYYFDELSTAQIAKKLKLSPSTVRNQLSRAREKIRGRLQGRYGENWSTLCTTLLLRPLLRRASIGSAALSSVLKPVLVMAVLTLGTYWAWTQWSGPTSLAEPQATTTSAMGERGGTSGNTVATSSAELAHADDSARRTAQRLSIEVFDRQARPLADTSCRIYAIRKPLSRQEMLGPEALQFSSFPILAEGVTSAAGVFEVDLSFDSELVMEPQLCVIVEKPAFAKYAKLIYPNLEQPEQSLRLTLELAAGGGMRILVVDENSQPIPTARVMPSLPEPDLLDQRFQRFFATTDDSGMASLNSLHPRVSELHCWAPGYQSIQVPIEAHWLLSPTQIMAEVPGSAHVTTVMLKRGLPADLHVTSAGQPYQGARIFLREGRHSDAIFHGAELEKGYLGETDHAGYLQVSGLSPNKRADLVVKIGGIERQIVSVEPESDNLVDFPALATLKGRVLLADGNPAAHALVMVADPGALSARHMSTAWTRPDGHFELPVKRGLFALSIIHPSGSVAASEVLDTGAEMDFGDMHLQIPPQVKLRIQNENGGLLDGVGEIKLLRHPELAWARFGQPQLLSKFWVTGLQSVLPFRTAQNEFIYKHLPAGEYWLRATAPGYVEQTISIAVDVNNSTTDIRLKRGLTASLRLVDANGLPVPNRAVEFAPTDYPWNWRLLPKPQRPSVRVQTVYSNAEGMVHFDGLIAGEWDLSQPGRAALGLNLARFQIKKDGFLGDVAMPGTAYFVAETTSAERVYEHSQILLMCGPGVHDGRRQPWRKKLVTNSLGHTETVALAEGDYQVRSLVANSLPRTDDIQLLGGQTHRHVVQLEGASLQGSLPEGLQNGHVLLLQRQPQHADIEADLTKRLRKVVRHPPAPGLGGSFRGVHGRITWTAHYAASLVAADGTFGFDHMPDGDYWLVASATGYRIGGPFDLSIRNGVLHSSSLGDDLRMELQPGAGFRLLAPGLMRYFSQHPDANLSATIEPGPASDVGGSEIGGKAPQPLTVDLTPSSEVVFEMLKDRPRHYLIHFKLQDGSGHIFEWNRELQTQAGQIEDVLVKLPK
jgi:RNA polymerase sigma factor (sigma-70 family)